MSEDRTFVETTRIHMEALDYEQQDLWRLVQFARHHAEDLAADPELLRAVERQEASFEIEGPAAPIYAWLP